MGRGKVLGERMKPLGHPKLKGISGRRKSKKSVHRSRCLRVDKKRARREAQLEAERDSE